MLIRIMAHTTYEIIGPRRILYGYNRLTQKSIAAVQDAQSIASRNTNQQVDQQHLMKALLDQKLIAELITRMGKDKDAFDAALDREISKLPKVTGSREEIAKAYVETLGAGDFDKLLQGISTT